MFARNNTFRTSHALYLPASWWRVPLIGDATAALRPSSFVFACFAALLLVGVNVSAEQETADALAPAPQSQPAAVSLKLREFESMTISALRREFPRLPGLFASASSCRLPEYGPIVSVTLQIPSFYFTRPVLMELERRQRVAEQQARKIRLQIDRAAQFINLKAREAALLDRINKEKNNSKKNEIVTSLENDLAEVRKTLETMETPSAEPAALQAQSNDLISDVDLNKMIVDNYQQMVQRVTLAIKNHLAENAPKVANIQADDKISISAHVRDNFLPNQSKSMIFILNGADIQEYRQGALDLKALKDRVVVKQEDRE